MAEFPVVLARGLRRDYGARRALRDLDFSVSSGEVFGLLGPNGGGKTTLFRILATLLQPTSGSASVLGHDVVREPDAVRAGIGVVFQAPALDRLLTVEENLDTQGRLYGMPRADRVRAIGDVLERLGLAARRRDRVGTLSGGLMRRVEIAKGVLHGPRLLLLDEPSTGLDPGARRDLWSLLDALRSRDGVTILLTTHLMEEAERCDRLAILSEGTLVACDTPSALKAAIGGDVIVIATRAPEPLRLELESRFGGPVGVVDGTVRLERRAGAELVPRIAEAFGDRIEAITLGRPTLLDVFVHKTGLRFEDGAAAAPPARGTGGAR